MTQVKENLINKARSIYSRIYPCGTKNSFSECFTSEENKILFWFDTEDHSTHLLVGENYQMA